MADRNEILARARALAPALRERAALAEQLRRTPDETIDDFRAAGFFRLMAPRHYGGQEAELGILLDAVIEIGRACGSSAWILCIYGIHNWLAGLFGREVQDELFSDGDHVLFPGSFAATGEATATDGGYRLTGHWMFASGVWHADWVAVAARIRVPGAERSRDVRCFLVRRPDFEVVDTWYVSGLRGTGSMDVQIHDAFVPDHRVVSFHDIADGTAPGALLHSAPIYRIPLFSALATIATAPAVGMAHGAVEYFRDRALTRVLRYANIRQADQPTSQVRFAEAAAEARAADLILHAAVEDLTRLTAAGKTLSQEQRAAIRRD